VGGDQGVPEAQLLAVTEQALDRELFDERVLAALDYADAMTLGPASDEFVAEGLFERVKSHFTTREIVGLTELIAWENASARFNRALGVESQRLWNR
jgi:alkylhydroperoxidase family enzyme